MSKRVIRGRSIEGAIALDRMRGDLEKGKIIIFHGEKPFILTSKVLKNASPDALLPSEEEIKQQLQELLEGQISRLNNETDYDAIITLAESIKELAEKIKDPSQYL